MNDEKWLLIKRDLYERPDRCGYTGIRDNAGRYSKEVAERHMGHHGPNSAVREEDAPEFRAAAFHDLVIAHLKKKIATARADGRREGLGEALEKFPVPYMDDAPSGVDREAWHLGYLRARSDFATAIRAMMEKE